MQEITFNKIQHTFIVKKTKKLGEYMPSLGLLKQNTTDSTA